MVVVWWFGLKIFDLQNIKDGYDRQVWMYSTLYQEMDRFRMTEVYEAAVKGGDFLIKFAKNKDNGKVYFSLNR